MLINYPYRKYSHIKKISLFDKGRIKYAQSTNLAEMGKKAAVINGDGTGPELVDAMIHVLEACNTQIELIRCEAGSEQWEKNGGDTNIPDSTSKIMEESDACYKGPTTTIPSPSTSSFSMLIILRLYRYNSILLAIFFFFSHMRG